MPTKTDHLDTNVNSSCFLGDSRRGGEWRLHFLLPLKTEAGRPETHLSVGHFIHNFNDRLTNVVNLRQK